LSLSGPSVASPEDEQPASTLIASRLLVIQLRVLGDKALRDLARIAIGSAEVTGAEEVVTDLTCTVTVKAGRNTGGISAALRS